MQYLFLRISCMVLGARKYDASEHFRIDKGHWRDLSITHIPLVAPPLKLL